MFADRPRPTGTADGRRSLTDALPVEHLQLRGSVTRALRERGIVAAGEVPFFMLRREIEHFPHAAELAEAVCQLESCRIEGEVDWPRYWRAREFRFHHLCACLQGLDRLSERARTHPVDREILGLAGLRLAACGYPDLGSLIDALKTGIPLPAGVGITKLQDFFERLVALSDRVDDDGELPWLDRRTDSAVRADPGILLDDLPECVAALPVDALCIGVKCRLLRTAGYRTIRELVSVDPGVLLRVPSVGRMTVTLALERAAKLQAAVVDGQLDWATWCYVTGVPLIPERGIANSRELIATLPEILQQVAEHAADPIVGDIIRRRLMPAPQDRASLDEIAARHPRSNGRNVSRQRIQQLESELLRQLAGTLVRGRDLGLGVCFHPEFTDWWRRAAREFADADEISLDDFLGRLASAWDVSVAELVPQFPVICAIVTGDARLPPELRNALRLRAPLYALSAKLAATPIRRFRLGRRADQLEEQGSSTLSDLIGLAKAGRCTGNVLAHLDMVADCLEGGEICWLKYREALGLRCVPDKAPGSSADFVSDFPATIRNMLELATPGGRSAEIFWRRTRLPDDRRPTLEVVGTALGTYGSSIKREETELLEGLNDVLVAQCFAEQPFWIDEGWLAFVRQAHDVFSRYPDDFEGFGASLAVRWQLTWQQLEAALPAMWAIFTGYPVRRRRPAYDPDAAPHVTHEPARIRLRGFRTVH